MDIDQLRDAINWSQVRVTDHADEEMFADGLQLDDVYQSVMSGEIIEQYPEDVPPRSLISGRSGAAEPIHSVWGYRDDGGIAVLITAYRPDDRWIDQRTRVH